MLVVQPAGDLGGEDITGRAGGLLPVAVAPQFMGSKRTVGALAA